MSGIQPTTLKWGPVPVQYIEKGQKGLTAQQEQGALTKNAVEEAVTEANQKLSGTAQQLGSNTSIRIFRMPQDPRIITGNLYSASGTDIFVTAKPKEKEAVTHLFEQIAEFLVKGLKKAA